MNKKLLKNIQQVADSMPVIMRNTHEKHLMKGAELLEMDMKEVDGKPVDPAAFYLMPFPVQIAINHKRKLKKEYKKHGMDGVMIYCTQVHAHETNKDKQ